MVEGRKQGTQLCLFVKHFLPTETVDIQCHRRNPPDLGGSVAWECRSLSREKHNIGANTLPGWVDPRQHPRPPAPSPRSDAEADPHEIAELLAFCSFGSHLRNRALDKGWTATPGDESSTGAVASKARSRSRSQRAYTTSPSCSLCNEYRLDLESNPSGTPLDRALQRRAWDLVELLLQWVASNCFSGFP